MNELLHETYRTLKHFGIVKSCNDFSRKMLGRSSRLYSWILATDHPPALDVMLGLYARLDDLCAEAEATGDLQRAKALDNLAERLWTEIRAESLTKGPCRRKKQPAHDAQVGS